MGAEGSDEHQRLISYRAYNLQDRGALTVYYDRDEMIACELFLNEGEESAESVLALINIDAKKLELIQEEDFLKVWKGTIEGITFREIKVVIGASGWNLAKVGFVYPRD